MKNSYKIESFSFEHNSIHSKIDGNLIKLPINTVSKKLKLANEIETKFFKISPSGYGIYWPLLDESLSIEFLLKN